MVELRRITEDNFEEVINLEVYENQESFVSSVMYSLAQAWSYKETAFPFAIYENEVSVGFVMLGYYKSKNYYTLWKFLIDKNVKILCLMCSIFFFTKNLEIFPHNSY